VQQQALCYLPVVVMDAAAQHIPTLDGPPLVEVHDRRLLADALVWTSMVVMSI
jgi:hypothetical protein